MLTNLYLTTTIYGRGTIMITLILQVEELRQRKIQRDSPPEARELGFLMPLPSPPVENKAPSLNRAEKTKETWGLNREPHAAGLGVLGYGAVERPMVISRVTKFQCRREQDQDTLHLLQQAEQEQRLSPRMRQNQTFLSTGSEHRAM